MTNKLLGYLPLDTQYWNTSNGNDQRAPYQVVENQVWQIYYKALLGMFADTSRVENQV